jgi:ribosome-associated heat shock protein Hsp15
LEIEVAVTGLSNVRRGAPEATQLYSETQASKDRQAALKAAQNHEFAARERGAGRPTKRQLRDIKKFTGMKF